MHEILHIIGLCPDGFLHPSLLSIFFGEFHNSIIRFINTKYL